MTSPIDDAPEYCTGCGETLPESAIDPEKQFIVVFADQKVAWGPFGSRREADVFADFVNAEIDPAEVRTLSSPVGELLAWRKAMEEFDRA